MLLCVGHSFASVAHLRFEGCLDSNQSAAEPSRGGANLVTHPSI